MSDFMQRLPKRVFVASLVFTSLGSAFLCGALAYRYSLPPIPQLKSAYKILFVEKTLTTSPIHRHLQPSRGQGNGVTVNKLLDDDSSLVFMVGFFDEENQIRLIRRDGTIVNKWSLNYFDHFPDSDKRICDLSTSLNTDIHGAHVTSQGDVVFNYEYCGTVKLNKCGEVLWNLEKATHHSLVPAETGGYWLLGRDTWKATEEPGRLPPFSTTTENQKIAEDKLLRISENGEIIEDTSILSILYENNLEALVTANGLNFGLNYVLNEEPVHSNKVSELPSKIADAFPLFSIGDLAISMRELNLIIVLDPANKSVKWHQTGPWLRQHDPEFRSDGRISIFNNNVYRTAYNNDKTILSTPFTTNIIAVDPVSRETEIIFGEKPGQEMLSVIRGQHEILDNDGMLITEFDAGRVFEVDADGQIVWEYVNRYDDEFVGKITNSAIYPAKYFEVDWEECGQ